MYFSRFKKIFISTQGQVNPVDFHNFDSEANKIYFDGFFALIKCHLEPIRLS